MLPEPTKEEIKKAKKEGRVLNANFIDLIESLDIKYGIKMSGSSYRTLEQYGDTILDLILYDKLRRMYGIDITAEDLSLFRGDMTSNKQLTEFSRELKICYEVYEVSPHADFRFNSICADTIESIIGVLYFQYGLKSVERIEQWFWSLPPIKNFYDQRVMQEDAKRRERIKNYNYFPSYEFHEKGNVNGFLKRYLDKGGRTGEKIELQLIPVNNGLYDYYLYNPKFNRKLYLATLEQDDARGLENVLVSSGIWLQY